MKTVGLEHTTLEGCIKDARRERVVVTRKGKPVALVVGVEGLDEEQLQLGSSDKFWTLIEARRKQKTISRTELERRIKDGNGSRETIAEKHETRVRQLPPNETVEKGCIRKKSY
jgi:antitoxin (DNA-binding transcriptional repressor) of toxin-antitoxin stability system